MCVCVCFFVDGVSGNNRRWREKGKPRPAWSSFTGESWSKWKYFEAITVHELKETAWGRIKVLKTTETWIAAELKYVTCYLLAFISPPCSLRSSPQAQAYFSDVLSKKRDHHKWADPHIPGIHASCLPACLLFPGDRRPACTWQVPRIIGSMVSFSKPRAPIKKLYTSAFASRSMHPY